MNNIPRWSCFEPSEADTAAFAAAQADARFSYADRGASRSGAPAGYNLDHNRIAIGSGEKDYAAACTALRNWKMFPSAWTRIVPAAAPIREGQVVALVIHAYGWWMSGARIVYVIDQSAPVRRCGFAYGTLESHVEEGEERFSVELTADGTVWYDLRAFSRPRFWLVRLVKPVARRLQRRFVLESQAAMRRAVADARDGRGNAHARQPGDAPRGPDGTASTERNPSARIGAVTWVAFCTWTFSGFQDDAWARCLLLFAALVLMPLALDLFEEPGEPPRIARGLAAAKRLQLPAAILLAIAGGISAGGMAAALAVPWLVFTALLGITGARRLRHHGWRRPLGRACRDVALMFVVVGGAWSLADRAAYRPIGFDSAIVLLTAVHFHFAGFLLPLFSGLVVDRSPASRLASQAAVAVVLAVPALAVGITLSHLGAPAAFEIAAGIAVALSAAAVAGFQLRIASQSEARNARVLLTLSSTCLGLAMVLAASYALRSAVVPFPWLGIPQMRALHGSLNALGFGLCGVLGWRRLARRVS